MINRNQDYKMYNEQSMLLDIQKLEFYIYDLALYLDTHTNDPVALYKHRQLTEHLMTLKNAYESQYGIMCLMDHETSETWRYVNGPWPWDR